MADDVRRVRRRVVTDGLAISFSAFAFGVVYGLAAREGGFSFIEAMAMSAIVLAGAAQFAAVGLVAQGVPWAGIVLLTGLLNARHLLYSASLAPWFAGAPRRVRAAAAFVLVDETYALAYPALRSLGRLDLGTYGVAAAMPVIPWLVATAVGYLGGGLMPEPRVLGMDVVFPAAMAGLAVALISDRRSLVAAVAGAIVGLAVALAVHPSVGVMAGGLAGPLIAMARPAPPTGVRPEQNRMSLELVALAVLMGAVTYPSRALPMLLPGIERLSDIVHLYLRLIGPAILASLAAVNVLVLDGAASLHVGVEALAVAVTIAVVAWRRNLLLGLVAAVILVAAARALGLAP